MTHDATRRPTPPTFSELELLLRLGWVQETTGTLVDVGAHVGRFSTAFAGLGWRVLAFEPAPEIYARLRENLHSYPEARAVQSAVADRAADAVDFFLSDEYWGIHSLRPFHETHRQTATVSVVRLDDALADAQFDEVSIIKIDAEGADLPALRGLDVQRWRPRLVMCEFMDTRSLPHFGWRLDDMVRHMAPFGYVPFVSQWAPIIEHSRESGGGGPFAFLRIGPYPTPSPPAWGNVIFVSPDDAEDFDVAALRLVAEIDDLRRQAVTTRDVRNRELVTAIEHRDRRRAELDAAIARRDARIAELDSAIVGRDRRIEELQSAMQQRDERIEALRARQEER